MSSLFNRGVLVEVPEEVHLNKKRVLDTTWVYTVKTGEGKVKRFKARLVVRGDHQIPSVDYDLVYALTLAYEHIRIALAHATVKQFYVLQPDIKTAYLNSPINRELYVRIGFPTQT